MNTDLQCEACRLGKMQLSHSTYANWLNNQLVVVPDVPIWVCDVCGEWLYDPDVVALTEVLLGIEPEPFKAEQPSRARSPMAYLAGLAVARKWSM